MGSGGGQSGWHLGETYNLTTDHKRARALRRAYPQRLTHDNQTAITMMLFGMINWTFTWLRPGGPMSYSAFADEVVAMLERGMTGSAVGV